MEPIYQLKMKVRDYELDSQGIVNNANYQHYYEVARHEFLEMHNLSFTKLQKDGIDAVVSSIAIKYRKSLVGSDEFMCTVNIKKQGIRYIFEQKIIRLSDNALCSDAKVDVVCLVNGKLSQPHVFDEAFKQYLID